MLGSLHVAAATLHHSRLALQKEITTLQLKLLRVNSALAIKTQYASRLEYLLHERSERIDQLQSTVDQLRLQNRLRDQQIDHLSAMLAPK